MTGSALAGTWCYPLNQLRELAVIASTSPILHCNPRHPPLQAVLARRTDHTSFQGKQVERSKSAWLITSLCNMRYVAVKNSTAA